MSRSLPGSRGIPAERSHRASDPAKVEVHVTGRTPAAELSVVQAPIDAIDYVITHGLCHVAEPHHGAAFFELLDKVMPDWERRKQRLERAMA